MDNLITYLCNYAFDHDIGYQLDRISYDPEDASFYLNLTNTVYINMNYKNKVEIPFQFAHELSHALNGDKGSNNFCSNVFYIREECAANRRAVGILLEYCDLNGLTFYNSTEFMDAFGIPSKAGYVVDNVFEEKIGI
ncbi:ImmA/IrrE family metallo-endopeptidase [Pediococcus pentosaceus]|uniref:ImmA/IrrE family metallo-endopeptidase n=1 Tax=Pediococcus pentosaceus TaxID=1255 RepID=UPI0018A18487|nr:ImmA/IrrE family metallo-endopeptidase [Pediococcus pentosaceus]MBF7103413.1 ImmA/IrrE family metallo-endopeptidase [Pediococcus pentosaceus]